MLVQVINAKLGYREPGSLRTKVYEPGEYLEIPDEKVPRLLEMKAVRIVNEEAPAAEPERKPDTPPAAVPDKNKPESGTASEAKKTASGAKRKKGKQNPEADNDAPPVFGAQDVVDA